MNHGWKVEQYGAPVQNTHHVGGIGFLEAAGLEQLIEHSVRVCVVFDLNHHSDALFGGFISNVSDADDNLFVHKLCDLNQHVGFLDLIWNFMNHDSLSFVVIKDFALGADVEAPFPCGVHIDDAIDAMNGSAGWEIWTFYVLHVFVYRDSRFSFGPCFKNGINVKVHRTSDLSQVVRRYASGHTDRNTVAAVEQQIRKTGGENRRFLL